MARQCEIIEVIGTTMLAGDNMLHMMKKFTVSFRKQAIFAALIGALTH